MTKHDVIVIGGSLAGAACVRELERLGIDAVAFERDRFPRAKVCGGFVSPGAVTCLDELGVLDEVQRAGAVEVRSSEMSVSFSSLWPDWAVRLLFSPLAWAVVSLVPGLVSDAGRLLLFSPVDWLARRRRRKSRYSANFAVL